MQDLRILENRLVSKADQIQYGTSAEQITIKKDLAEAKSLF